MNSAPPPMMFGPGTSAPNLNIKGSLISREEAFQRAEIEAALEEDKAIEHLHLLVSTFQKGRDYTNFIIAAGYAAFFALWVDVAPDIDREARLLSGGLMAISLVAFIVWELVKAVGVMQEGDRIATAIWRSKSRSELAQRTREAQSQINVADIKREELWPAFFITSTLTGFIAGVVLALAALAEWSIL